MSRTEAASAGMVLIDCPAHPDRVRWSVALKELGVNAYLTGEAGDEELRSIAVVVADSPHCEVVKKLGLGPELIVVPETLDQELMVACVRARAYDLLLPPADSAQVVARAAAAAKDHAEAKAGRFSVTTHAIFATREAERLPEAIVEVAMQVMAADDVSLLLPGPTGRLYIAHSYGLSPEQLAQAARSVGEGVAARVGNWGEPVLIRDLHADLRFSDIRPQNRVRSSIVYPLRAADRLVGVLNLNRFDPARPFGRADLDRAAALASQVLLALENARLVRQMVSTDRLASIGQLAAGVAHEINNPVSYVLANIEYVLEGFSTLSALAGQISPTSDGSIGTAEVLEELKSQIDQLKTATQDAAEGAARIREIAADMRTLSRTDDQRDVAFDLNEAIRSALRIVGAQIRGAAALEATLEPGLEVIGSAGRMSQVFVNLLVNAAQAVSDRGGPPNQIRVRSWRDGNQVFAQVSDTGLGIAPENISRIFEPFFTTKGPKSGTGLGLSISRDIVRRHGGDLRVESEPGQGTVFTVTVGEKRA